MPTDLSTQRKWIAGRSIRWNDERASQAYARGQWVRETLADALQKAAEQTPQRILLIDAERSIDCGWNQLAVRPRDRNQLGAGEKFRRAAFIGVDMGLFVAIDRAPGRRKLGQGERVRRRARRHQERRHFAFEHIAEQAVQPPGGRIGAIAGGGALVFPRDRGDHLGRDRTGIVALEIHRRPRSPRPVTARRPPASGTTAA